MFIRFSVAAVMAALLFSSCKKDGTSGEEPLDPAVVESIEPASAKANEEICVTGTNFSPKLNENVIVINGKDVIPYEMEDAGNGRTRLYAAVPSRLGSGNVGIKVRGSLYESGIGFEYIKTMKFSNIIGGIWGDSYGEDDPNLPKFNGVIGGCADENGHILVAELWTNCIRKVNPVGPTIELWAGKYKEAETGKSGFRTATGINNPKGIISVGENKYIIFSDTQVHLVEGDNITLLGKTRDTEGDKLYEGPVEHVSFCGTQGAAYDSKNNWVYFGCFDGPKHFILKYDMNTQMVSLAAGNYIADDSQGNVDGDATTVGRVSDVTRMTVASDGTLYFIESWKHVVRKLSDGVLTTVAGEYEESGCADGTGNQARFNFVDEGGEVGGGLVEDEDGNILIADPGNHAIRKMTPDGTVTTISAMQYDENGNMVPNKWAYKDDYDPNIGGNLGATQYVAHPMHIFKISDYTYGICQYSDAPGIRQLSFE